jgi:hypothetical protein
MTPGKLEQSEAEANDVAYTLREIKPEDLDIEWIAKMLNRLLKELERQLKAVENSEASAKPEAADLRYKNARTLSTLRSTFADALRLKGDLDAKLKSASKKKPGEHRAALQRKFDQIFERERANRICTKPDGR